MGSGYAKISRAIAATSILIIVLVLFGGGAAAAPKKASTGKTAKTQKEKIAQTELPEVVVFLEPGTDPVQFAKDNGFTLVRQMRSIDNAYVFNTAAAPSPQLTQEARKSKLQQDKRVRKAFVNHHVKAKKMGFTPNDPYFHHNTPSVGWNGDWHLINELGNGGIDTRVQDVWTAGITGNGVTLAIVDDSIQIAHPDLSPHYNATDSWDFGDNTAVPNPVYSDDNHGTMVGGVAAAAGGNSIGVCGAAPMATLACLRLDFNTGWSESTVADANLYHSSGTNRAIKIKNHSYAYTDPWIDLPLEKNSLATSAAAGTIHVFAAGNSRGSTSADITQDANKAMYQSNPNVITVAAVDQQGNFKYYSSFGACVFVSAPSGVLSTDRTGISGENNGTSSDFPDNNYIDGIEGTSFSAPLAAGVLALVKQAQPALNLRLAKHLLARCSDIIDSDDTSAASGGGWRTNAAGFRFNENYGFGLINAKRLVAMAQKYNGVSKLQTETKTVTANLTIPDSNSSGVTSTFTINSATPLEDILVTVHITHTYIGDLEIYLTSPKGTKSRLMIHDSMDNTHNLDWTLLSNAFWGENPEGTWSLNVRDLESPDNGTLDSYTVEAHMGYPTYPTAAKFENYE